MRHHPSSHRPERRIGAILPLVGLALGAAVAIPAAAVWSIRSGDGPTAAPSGERLDRSDQPSGLPTEAPRIVPFDTVPSEVVAVPTTLASTTTVAPVEPAPTPSPPTIADVPTDELPSTTAVPGPAPVCDVPSLPSTAFAPDSADLDDEAESLLDEIAAALADTSGTVTIDGHTDERESGFEGGNDALSKARAAAVLDALADRGIPRERMESNGFGATVPVEDASTEEAYAKNRRVEISAVC